MAKVMTESDFKEFMKEQGFKKVPYKNIWEKDRWHIYKYSSHLTFYGASGRLVGKYLVYHEWNNFFNFKCAVRDLVN
jgi:hypothetical protein